MVGFLLFYLLGYGGIHFYLLLKVRAALALHGLMLAPLGMMLLLLFLAPLLVWRLEAIGLQALVKPVAFVAYCWMGFIFLFFSISLGIELLLWLLKVGATFFSWSLPTLTARPQLLLAFTTALLTAFWGFIEARAINVEQVSVSLPNLPSEAEGYRIVQISDIHLGVMTNRHWLDELVSAVNGLQPDLIVATGDVVDSHVDGSREFAEAMQRLRAHDGKYAIPGNHEHYAGIERSLDFFREAGLTPLVDSEVSLRPGLTLVGVDDRGRHTPGNAGPERELPLLQQARGLGGAVILLKHQPLLGEGSAGLFDLQLSGHVHQGQIYPFRYLTRLAYKMESGLNSLGQGSYLYLNRGTGTWGPPMRVLAPPEITLLVLRHAP